MKKPSPALDEGPLPGLSGTNYKVLAGITALGLAAPALLFAVPMVTEALKPPPPTCDAKGKPAGCVKAPEKKSKTAKMTLPKKGAATLAPAPKPAPPPPPSAAELKAKADAQASADELKRLKDVLSRTERVKNVATRPSAVAVRKVEPVAVVAAPAPAEALAPAVEEPPARNLQDAITDLRSSPPPAFEAPSKESRNLDQAITNLRAPAPVSKNLDQAITNARDPGAVTASKAERALASKAAAEKKSTDAAAAKQAKTDAAQKSGGAYKADAAAQNAQKALKAAEDKAAADKKKADAFASKRSADAAAAQKKADAAAQKASKAKDAAAATQQKAKDAAASKDAAAKAAATKKAETAKAAAAGKQEAASKKLEAAAAKKVKAADAAQKKATEAGDARAAKAAYAEKNSRGEGGRVRGEGCQGGRLSQTSRCEEGGRREVGHVRACLVCKTAEVYLCLLLPIIVCCHGYDARTSGRSRGGDTASPQFIGGGHGPRLP